MNGHSSKVACRAILGIFALSACTVGPNFKPDTMPIPARFDEQNHAATPQEVAQTEREMRDWWKQFGDPVLDELVSKALDNNNDLRIADERIIDEHGLRAQAVSAWYPQLDANLGGGDTQYSTVIDNWPLRPGNVLNHPHASILTYGVTAQWELDVFGRIRRDVQAADRALDASIEMRRETLMVLLSSLVRDYIELRGTQLRLTIIQNNVDKAAEELAVTQRLFRQGVGNTLQIAQAQSEHDSEMANLEPLKAQCAKLAHAIAVLLGEMPETLSAKLLKAPRNAHVLPLTPIFPKTLPSLVIANRPDIRRAEQEYARATAEIGVAIAQLYPRFSIPLTFNPNASALYQVVQANAMSWSVLLLGTLPIMHGGKLSAEVRSAWARARAQQFAYRQTVLNGLREVEDAIVSWQHDDRYVDRLHRASFESRLASDRARRLFGSGLTDYLNVLSTQRTALNSEDREALARIRRLQDSVDLYVAIGAGWRGVALRADVQRDERKNQSVLQKVIAR